MRRYYLSGYLPRLSYPTSVSPLTFAPLGAGKTRDQRLRFGWVGLDEHYIVHHIFLLSLASFRNNANNRQSCRCLAALARLTQR